jgi:hypothetical protein
MTAKILLDSYANVRISPTFLKTWGPENGYEVLGFAAYLWGSDNALCGTALPAQVQPITHQWLEELTAAKMGFFGNLELGSNDPSNLGAAGGVERASLAVACYQALKVGPGIPLCLSNDHIVTNEDNVVAFYTEADRIIRDAGYEPTIYGQSSVYETLLAHGIEWLWHAPDGTTEPAGGWPKGTLIAQRPSFIVNPQGYSADVDDVVDVEKRLWNNDGPVSFEVAPPPPPPPPPVHAPEWPKPDGQKGEWVLCRPPTASAAFYLLNVRENMKHSFNSNESQLYQDYVRAGFTVYDVSVKIVQDAREI